MGQAEMAKIVFAPYAAVRKAQVVRQKYTQLGKCYPLCNNNFVLLNGGILSIFSWPIFGNQICKGAAIFQRIDARLVGNG
jgi:hypothetical protein